MLVQRASEERLLQIWKVKGGGGRRSKGILHISKDVLRHWNLQGDKTAQEAWKGSCCTLLSRVHKWLQRIGAVGVGDERTAFHKASHMGLFSCIHCVSIIADVFEASG